MVIFVLTVRLPEVEERRRQDAVGAYSDRVGFRRDRGGDLFVFGEETGGFEAVIDPDAAAGLVEVRINRVLGDVQLTGNSL